jgi:SAM-dependent methyltransferase
VVIRVGGGERHRQSIVVVNTPALWLTANAELLPRDGDALDVACGSGRHALWLAERGLRTLAVDRSPDHVRVVNEEGRRAGLPVRAEVMDLEDGPVRIAASGYDVIVVVHYLHRPLFPDLIGALRPGGVLVYETFTRAQAMRGKPTNPAFLLEPGELLKLTRPLEVLASREGDYEGRMIASIVARKNV